MDLNESDSSLTSAADYEWEDYCYILTKEEQNQGKQEEQREREAITNKIKEEQKEKRLLKKEEMKKSIARPIKPLPERELCQYEKIREYIIRERQGAMANFGFFEDLDKTKEALGLHANKSQKKEN